MWAAHSTHGGSPITPPGSPKLPRLPWGTHVSSPGNQAPWPLGHQPRALTAHSLPRGRLTAARLSLLQNSPRREVRESPGAAPPSTAAPGWGPLRTADQKEHGSPSRLCVCPPWGSKARPRPLPAAEQRQRLLPARGRNRPGTAPPPREPRPPGTDGSQTPHSGLSWDPSSPGGQGGGGRPLSPASHQSWPSRRTESWHRGGELGQLGSCRAACALRAQPARGATPRWPDAPPAPRPATRGGRAARAEAAWVLPSQHVALAVCTFFGAVPSSVKWGHGGSRRGESQRALGQCPRRAAGPGAVTSTLELPTGEGSLGRGAAKGRPGGGDHDAWVAKGTATAAGHRLACSLR